MSEGQSQRSVASSAQHRHEAEVATTEERERAAAETAATAARAARLAIAELAAARVEVEAAAARMQRVQRRQSSRLYAPVAPATLFLPTTTETTSSSWRGRQRGSRRRSGQPRTPRGAVVAAQTGADAQAAGLTEIAAFTGGAALPPRTDTMGSRPLSGTSVSTTGDLPTPRPTTSSGPR
jgi:hypothetical protein